LIIALLYWREGDLSLQDSDFFLSLKFSAIGQIWILVFVGL
jgi:hypothetical protein